MGGHVNVLCSAYIRCCYAAEIATLPRSLVSLLRYTCCYAAEISGFVATLHVAIRCRDLWFRCYVTCCYAAEISGFVAT